MAEKLLMLALSPTMETGTIARWSVKEGEAVHSGDILCEVETDKTTMEYETTSDGTLLKILVQAGGVVKVGDPIAIVGDKGESVAGLDDAVRPNAVAEISTVAGGNDAVLSAGRKEVPDAPARETALGGRLPGGIPSSPLARRIAREKGLDLASVTGSGPGGRIVKRDVESAPNASQSPLGQSQSASDADDDRAPLSEKRKVIARRLSQSFYTAPHYYLKAVVDAGALLEARGRINVGSKVKISLNAFIMKLVGVALKRHPKVNASLIEDTIILHRRVDIALAVAQDDGLITPVVRGVDRKGLEQIDIELQDLVERARNNRLLPEEYTGGTFTVSNLGSFGVREFTAIINPPESAILAVGEIAKQPVVGDNDSITIRPQVVFSLSCDHRILDGAVAAAFLRDLKVLAEDPVRALL